MSSHINLSLMISFILNSFFFLSVSNAAINVAAMTETPAPENAKIEIIYPKNMEVENSQPIKMQVKVSNYPLGEDSDFPRKNQIKNSTIGQSIRVIIDNDSFFSKVTKQINSEGTNLEQLFEFNLPDNLSEGEHILRAFLVRSFGESLKVASSFASSTFYYKDKTQLKEVDLNKPYLTSNEPESSGIYDDAQPILLDFYIKNCLLSKGGYKVKMTIDKEDPRYLDKWVPYLIYGLRKGPHQIGLQLVDKNNNLVPGLFNNVKTEFRIK